MQLADYVDGMRAKSPRINGKFSGRMKRGIDKIKEITCLLSERAEAGGSEDKARHSVSNMAREIKLLKEEISRLKEDNKQLKLENKKTREYYERLMAPSTSSKASPPGSPPKKRSPSYSEVCVISNRKSKNGTSKSEIDNKELVTLITDNVVRSLNAIYGVHLPVSTSIRSDVDSGTPMPVSKKSSIRETNRKLRIEKEWPPLRRKLAEETDLSVSETPLITATDTEAEWVQVSRKRKKKNRKKEVRDSLLPSSLPSQGRGRKGTPREDGKGKGRESRTMDSSAKSGLARRSGIPTGDKRRPPRTAAITIKTSEGKSCDEIFYKIREMISLSEFGIERTRTRYTQSGDLLLEIHGENNAEKADKLAAKARQLVSPSVRISRPVKMACIKILGIDNSIKKEEIIAAVSNQGRCKLEEVTVSQLWKTNNRLSVIWIRYPLPLAALRLSREGRMNLCWTEAKVVLQEERPTQCYRCLGFGHLSRNCKSTIDRSGSCYRCGEKGHSAKVCEKDPKCILCFEAGCNQIIGWVRIDVTR